MQRCARVQASRGACRGEEEEVKNCRVVYAEVCRGAEVQRGTEEVKRCVDVCRRAVCSVQRRM
jgi:hypothetical protein